MTEREPYTPPPVPGTTVAATSHSQPGPRRPGARLFIGVFVALGLAFGAGYWTASADSGGGLTESIGDSASAVALPSAADPSAVAAALLETAYDRCQEEVAHRLKAPGTARFPDLEDVDSRVTTREISIGGYVDAENGFGALLRLTWSCQIALNSTGVLGTVEVTVREP